MNGDESMNVLLLALAIVATSYVESTPLSLSFMLVMLWYSGGVNNKWHHMWMIWSTSSSSLSLVSILLLFFISFHLVSNLNWNWFTNRLILELSSALDLCNNNIKCIWNMFSAKVGLGDGHLIWDRLLDIRKSHLDDSLNDDAYILKIPYILYSIVEIVVFTDTDKLCWYLWIDNCVCVCLMISHSISLWNSNELFRHTETQTCSSFMLCNKQFNKLLLFFKLTTKNLDRTR